jgi:hypothetical protein
MAEQKQILRAYLLGQLPAAEETAFEARYFTDAELFAQLVEAEHELLDQHAHGLLSSDIRDQFERHYLADSRRRARAEFADTLAEKIQQRPKPATPPVIARDSWLDRLLGRRSPRLGWAVALALLLLVSAVIWFSVETRRLHQQLAREEAERSARAARERELEQRITAEQEQSAQLSAELERLRANQAAQPSPTPAAPSFVSLALTIGGLRSADTGAPATLVIPPQTDQVRLQLNLKESDYPNYRAVLQSANGNEVFSWKQLSASRNRSGAHFTLTLPAQRFTSGDYLLTLTGVRPTGEADDVSQLRLQVDRK